MGSDPADPHQPAVIDRRGQVYGCDRLASIFPTVPRATPAFPWSSQLSRSPPAFEFGMPVQCPLIMKTRVYETGCSLGRPSFNTLRRIVKLYRTKLL